MTWRLRMIGYKTREKMNYCECKTWEKICKGKDISISFPVLVDGESVSLDTIDVSIELIDPRGGSFSPQFTTDGNTVHFTFYGTEQPLYGIYSIRVWLNKDKENQTMMDITNALELVRTTEEEREATGEQIKVVSVKVSTNIAPDAIPDGEGVSISGGGCACFDGEGVVIK